jgi:hypothetical protein
MNMNSALDMARDCPRHGTRRQFFGRLWELKRESGAAIPGYRCYLQDRALALVDDRGVGWMRIRLREFVRLRPEVFVIDRGGKDRQ